MSLCASVCVCLCISLCASLCVSKCVSAINICVFKYNAFVSCILLVPVLVLCTIDTSYRGARAPKNGRAHVLQYDWLELMV